MSCISLQTTVIPGAGEIGNNGYAKFWCVNKFRFDPSENSELAG